MKKVMWKRNVSCLSKSVVVACTEKVCGMIGVGGGARKGSE